MKKEFYTRNQMHLDLLDLVRQMSKDNWKPDVIIGPARGGLIPATLLSYYYDVPMIPVRLSLRDFPSDVSKVRLELPNIQDYRKILIVDDIVDSGETLKLLMKILGQELERKFDDLFPNNENYEVKSAVLYHNLTNEAKYNPDYSVREINKVESPVWVVFPWETWWCQPE